MWFLAFGVVVLLFGFVLLYGAPYLPTMRRESQVALSMLKLKKGETLYELGCGDGRVLKQAAKQGIHTVGYELNPILVLVAWLHTIRYRKQVKIVWGNFWKADLSKADGVFVFLLDRFMTRLDHKMQTDAKKPIKLVSFAFKIPGKKIVRTTGGMYLYEYK